MKKTKFTIHLPNGYKRVKLPFFKEWVSALESGKFRRTSCVLCEKDRNGHLKYCCLGVLCKIAGIIERDTHNKRYVVTYDGDTNTDILPPLFVPELDGTGIFPAGVHVKYTHANGEVYNYLDLADCNDSDFFSFKDIAKIIRRIWKA